MKLHKWKDVRKRNLPPETLARIDRKVAQELLEMDLREIRKMLGKTQAEVARALKATQSKVSKVEGRRDFLFSTIRDVIRAMGGEIEIRAHFGKKSVRLHVPEVGA
ncbi:MAG: helix-turn-helix transcriptional regulator [Bdellovibrionota bacterium]